MQNRDRTTTATFVALTALAGAATLCFALFMAEGSGAVESDELTLAFASNAPCVVTNASGETLAYDGRSFSGDMERVVGKPLGGFPTTFTEVTINATDSLEMRTSGTTAYFCVTDDYRFVNIVSGYGPGTVTFSKKDGGSSVRINGSRCDYLVTGRALGGSLVDVEGIFRADASISFGDDCVMVSGVRGECDVSVQVDGSAAASGRYYLFDAAATYTATFEGGKLSVPGAAKIREGASKSVTGLRLMPANGGKNMFLTWNTVKKAKSYRVYARGPAKGKWRCVAVLEGNRSNFYTFAGAPAQGVYRYRIRAFKKAGGKKLACKASYEVSAVSGLDARRSNAFSVVTSRGSLRGGPGGSAKVSARVAAPTGKALLSGKVRWYSSNKKVAKIGRKSGKVSFRKRGTCRIWAKAHNGVNSKAIRVTVK